MTVFVAPNQISYRIGVDDSTWSGHTWKEAKNTAAAWYVGTSGRVRIQVDQPNAANWTPALRLQVKIKSTGSWNSLPITQASASATTGSFWVYNSANETHGSTITATACGSTPSTWQNGLPGYHDTANPGVAQGNIRAEYTELEWSLKCLASARTQATYFFRMVNNGTVFTTYTRLADVKTLGTVTTVSSFSTLDQSASIKELGFSTLDQAAKVLEFSFASLAQSGSLKELGFATLADAGTSKELGFSTLVQQAVIKELSFAALAQAADIVNAVSSSFTTLSQAATLKEIAFSVLDQSATIKEFSSASLAQTGSIKELAAATLAQSAALKELGFTALGQNASVQESAIATLAQSANLKELGFAALANTGVEIGRASCR